MKCFLFIGGYGGSSGRSFHLIFLITAAPLSQVKKAMWKLCQLPSTSTLTITWGLEKWPLWLASEVESRLWDWALNLWNLCYLEVGSSELSQIISHPAADGDWLVGVGFPTFSNTHCNLMQNSYQLFYLQRGPLHNSLPIGLSWISF